MAPHRVLGMSMAFLGALVVMMALASNPTVKN
jgi:hypothetical protein